MLKPKGDNSDRKGVKHYTILERQSLVDFQEALQHPHHHLAPRHIITWILECSHPQKKVRHIATNITNLSNNFLPVVLKGILKVQGRILAYWRLKTGKIMGIMEFLQLFLRKSQRIFWNQSQAMIEEVVAIVVFVMELEYTPTFFPVPHPQALQNLLLPLQDKSLVSLHPFTHPQSENNYFRSMEQLSMEEQNIDLFITNVSPSMLVKNDNFNNKPPVKSASGRIIEIPEVTFIKTIL
jgi:hypothetical protein